MKYNNVWFKIRSAIIHENMINENEKINAKKHT